MLVQELSELIYCGAWKMYKAFKVGERESGVSRDGNFIQSRDLLDNCPDSNSDSSVDLDGHGGGVANITCDQFSTNIGVQVDY